MTHHPSTRFVFALGAAALTAGLVVGGTAPDATAATGSASAATQRMAWRPLTPGVFHFGRAEGWLIDQTGPNTRDLHGTRLEHTLVGDPDLASGEVTVRLPHACTKVSALVAFGHRSPAGSHASVSFDTPEGSFGFPIRPSGRRVVTKLYGTHRVTFGYYANTGAVPLIGNLRAYCPARG